MRRARPLLGTLVEIEAHGNPAVLPVAVDHAFTAIDRVHQLMSFHDPRSDVSRLNQGAYRRPVEIDRHTVAVLALARRISRASNGAFDVTVAPRLVGWGYLPARERSLPAVMPDGYRAIELLAGNRVRFREKVLIDLGGIAKGYAVDLACAALERYGVIDYVVNAGGDLRVGATPTPIYVRHPRQPAMTLMLAVIDGIAVATSGRYFATKSVHGHDVHPIVAPATADPAPYRGSISVRASSCVTADALTKVVALLGTNAAPILDSFCAQATLLSETGEWRLIPDRLPDASAHIGPYAAAAANA